MQAQKELFRTREAEEDARENDMIDGGGGSHEVVDSLRLLLLASVEMVQALKTLHSMVSIPSQEEG